MRAPRGARSLLSSAAACGRWGGGLCKGRRRLNSGGDGLCKGRRVLHARPRAAGRAASLSDPICFASGGTTTRSSTTTTSAGEACTSLGPSRRAACSRARSRQGRARRLLAMLGPRDEVAVIADGNGARPCAWLRGRLRAPLPSAPRGCREGSRAMGRGRLRRGLRARAWCAEALLERCACPGSSAPQATLLQPALRRGLVV